MGKCENTPGFLSSFFARQLSILAHPVHEKRAVAEFLPNVMIISTGSLHNKGPDQDFQTVETILLSILSIISAIIH